MSILHTEVVKIIEEYRKTTGEPPEDMMFLYEYLHGQFIEREKEIRILHQMYNTK